MCYVFLCTTGSLVTSPRTLAIRETSRAAEEEPEDGRTTLKRITEKCHKFTLDDCNSGDRPNVLR